MYQLPMRGGSPLLPNGEEVSGNVYFSAEERSATTWENSTSTTLPFWLRVKKGLRSVRCFSIALGIAFLALLAISARQWTASGVSLSSLTSKILYKDTRVTIQKPADALEPIEGRKWNFGNVVHHNSDSHIHSSGSDSRYFSRHTLRDSSRLDDELCLDSAREKFDAERCLGAPFLYVTFHGGNNNRRVKTVCKFTRDGCGLGSALMPSDLHSIHSLRGMLDHRNFLFVAESWKKNSRVLRYSRCNPALEHRRELLDVVVDANDEVARGMIHPYGFAKKSGDPNLYVSTQGTSLVLRYNEETGAPAESPKSFSDEEGDEYARERDDMPRAGGDLYKGTFANLGTDEVRGLAFDNQGLLYVANKQRGVLVYDSDGYYIGLLPGEIIKPISVHFCSTRGSIWVGSAKEHVLYEFDSSTWQLLQTIDDKHLKHPAGFVTHGDSLFVVSQRRYKLLEFSMMTGKLLNVVLRKLRDVGERVLLSSC